MRYAVPVMDGGLSAHFGHCQQFALIDTDREKGIVLRKEFVNPPSHAPGVLPAWLAEQGVSVVIAGGMGSRAQAIFRENHIEVIIGAREGDPEEAVLNCIAGTLVSGDNLCDH